MTKPSLALRALIAPLALILIASSLCESASAAEFVIGVTPTSGQAASAPSTAPASAPTSAPQANEQPWLDDLKKAYTQAKQSKKPILVRAGAPWCGWCQKLEIELRTPLVQSQLSRWVLVYLDVDAQPAQAQAMHVGGIPALRLLSPSGSMAAEQDGFLPAAELTTWLQQNYDKALSAISETLLAEGPVDANMVTQLVARLDMQDSGTREAIIQRLATHRQEAGRAVAAAFRDGKLAARLSALELLREWKAPVDDLDPWDPPTFTTVRLVALRTWSEQLPAPPITTAPASQPQTLNDSQTDELLGRLLLADDPAERDAMVEQLARRGDPLLPTIYNRLKNTQDPQQRATLTLLRYRMMASSTLVLGWPGGLERLSSTQAATRQTAAQELTKRATPAEARLLTELFSDADPLVREISLTALREVGGAEAVGVITRLLKDPDANVRAGVLKVLAEKPSAEVVDIIGAYSLEEKDPDLVGHAARALRAARTAPAAKALLKLLGHESWRVRAEAAEGLGEILKNEQHSETLKADGYTALIKRLEDEDGFVVSQAMTALKDSSMLGTAIEPMLSAMRRHPELAANVVAVFGSDSGIARQALPQLRELCHHADASVRAAAIKAVCSADGQGADAQIVAGLADSSAEVRMTTAEAAFEALDSIRQSQSAQSGTMSTEGVEEISVTRMVVGALFGRRASTVRIPESQPASQAASPAASQPVLSASAIWLDRFHRGAGRPAWLEEIQPTLVTMMRAPSVDERLGASLCLIAAGKTAQALPAIEQIVVEKKSLLRSAGKVLPWLEPAVRVSLFQRWVHSAASGSELAMLSRQLNTWSEPEMLPALWDVLGNDSLAPEAVEGILEPMVQYYLGNNRWQPSNAPVAARVRMGTDAKAHLGAKSEWQRLVALVLLAYASKDEASTTAEKLFQESPSGSATRRDAFQLLLLTESRTKAEADAVAAISADDPGARTVGLQYLAMGPLALQQLRGRIAVNLDVSSQFQEMNSNEPRVFRAPSGVNSDALQKLLSEKDRETVVSAAYLLALTGRTDVIETLVKAWREGARHNDIYQQLVYRAIAATNDESRVPLLEEMYAGFQKNDYRVRDFYWSIRGMTGPRVLALRKKMRDEVGMQMLK